jgi:hypothetical protein
MHYKELHLLLRLFFQVGFLLLRIKAGKVSFSSPSEKISPGKKVLPPVRVARWFYFHTKFTKWDKFSRPSEWKI